MNRRRFIPCVLFSFLFLLWTPFAKADGWQPIDPADLAMKDNPAQPGAKAMILYRSIDRNDKTGSQQEYVRIKIFTEEGKSYADVTIPPFDRAEFKFSGVSGRTIHPDGSIVPFNGQVFERPVEVGGGSKYMAKGFTMPDVTPGSIIEYRYTRYFEAYNPSTRVYYYFPRSEWSVQGSLFQRQAHFEFRPCKEDMFSYRVEAVHVPEGTKLNSREDLSDRTVTSHIITLELNNIPAFEREPYMLPSGEVEMRVLFFYSPDFHLPMGDEFWKAEGKKWIGSVEGFMDKKGALNNAVGSVTAGSDAPEVKLRKLYDYVQTFENSTFEDYKTRKETKALNIGEIKSVEDVINSKYGSRNQLNRTFVALAKHAGIDATLVKVPERDEALLHKDWPSFSQLTYELAIVKLNGKTLYLDPGSPYCPFGVLPWEDSGVTGLVLDKNLPTWAQLPIADVTQGSTKRTAKLALGDDGAVTGEVVVTFSGEDAFRRRLRVRNEDDTERKKAMEKLLQEWLLVKGDVELTNVNDWKSSSLPLVATYKVILPGYASQAGKRLMVPATFFAGAYRNPFTATNRVNAVMFDYEYDHADDVTIALPKTVQVESLPKSQKASNGLADIIVDYTNDNSSLHFTRDFQLKSIGMEQKYYTAMRNYFQAVQAGANEQAVLRMGN